MKLFDEALGEIDRGRKGLYEGLDNGFHRLNKYLFGVQRGTYYTLVGPTGSGKTALTDSMFLYNPYMYRDKQKIKIIYYSLEITAVRKIIKFICRTVYEKYGVVLDINEALSRGKNRLADNMYEKIKAIKEFYEPLEDILEVKDHNASPKFIYKDLKSIAEKRGKFEEVGGRLIYTANDPDEYVIVIVDHMGLISGADKKAVIDETSGYLVWFRNKCNYSPVMVAQLNRDSTSSDRRKTGFTDIQLSDIKSTGNVAEDSNVVLSLFSPYREKIDNYKGYDIGVLKDRFRAASILKNRDSEAEKTIGLNFFGEIGLFNEMPRAEDITNMEEYASIYRSKIQ